MHTEDNIQAFPTLHARMGDWHYYITTLPFSEVAKRVRPATEILVPRNMNDWIQRNLNDDRIKQIANYLISQDQHFFPAIVVGVYMGEPTWYEIEVAENSIFGTPGLDPRSKYTLGILKLDGTEKLYAIDGQHRVAGIKEALRQLSVEERLDELDRLANETLSILFVSADVYKTGRERVRRLFTTLNKAARPVSEPEIIALDEDDIAAIATRNLVIDYEGFNPPETRNEDTHISLVQLGTRHEIPPSNTHSITTIVSLYRMIKKVFQAELSSLKKVHQGNRPDDNEIESISHDAAEIWDLLQQNDHALSEVLGSDPREERVAQFRNRRGGHILFRPVGLQAFSGALGVLRMRGIDTERAVRSLCRLPVEISEEPWKYVIWNPHTRRMIASNRVVAEALFLHMLGQAPRTSNYDLRGKYNDLLGNPPGDAFAVVQTYDLLN